MAITPTLRLILTQQAERQCIDQGIDIDAGFQQLVAAFRKVDLTTQPTFDAALVEDVKTRARVTNFETIVVGRFTTVINGAEILNIVTATGDVIEMRLFRG